MTRVVYHVELRAFPHVARVFDLDRATLLARFVEPYAAGRVIELDDRRWSVERTRLTVLEDDAPVTGTAPVRGLGRGWGEVTRRSRNVTEALVAEAGRGAAGGPEVAALRSRVVDGVAASVSAGMGFGEVLALADETMRGRRASERLAVAEQVVWELLHRGGVELVDADGAPVAAERWEGLVLDFGTWAQTGEELHLIQGGGRAAD